MIAKKKSGHDLERKRTALFHVGLLTATAATLAAFSYQKPMSFAEEKAKVVATSIDYMVEPEIKEEPIVRQLQTQQTQQRQDDHQQQQSSNQSQQVSELTQTTQNDPNRNPDAGIDLPDVGPGLLVYGMDIEDEAVIYPDIEAKYIGGNEAMQLYIAHEINYPQESIEIDEQGKVFVQFIVEKDGSVSNVTILRGISSSLDREAKRVVRNFPNWTPGMVKGEKVRTVVQLPIHFILE